MIHYHGTPCGSTREDVARFLSGRHALIPWVRPEDVSTAAAVCQSMCFDNGAFTAWKQGKPITDWSGYYEWCREWSTHPSFDWALIPDVIDGSESDNDDLIRQWDKKMWHPRHVEGVPVWHLHESLERLDRLVTGRYRRIALGSSGEWPTPGTRKWWGRMKEAMTIACDEHGRPKAKLHGLRMLDAAIFTRLPLASADSTNAVRNAASYRRFGMYRPPNNSTRMAIIAEQIESQQSAACWASPDKQIEMFCGEKLEV